MAPRVDTVTSSTDLPSRTSVVVVGDGIIGTCTAFFLARKGVPVVALHGCGGLGGPDRPMHLPAREADWAARLAAEGHPVLFPDSFGPRGVAEVCHGGERGIQPENLRRGDALAAVHREGEILSTSNEGEGIRVRARLSRPSAGRLVEFVVDPPVVTLRR